jgi:hypothetical protein
VKELTNSLVAIFGLHIVFHTSLVLQKADMISINEHIWTSLLNAKLATDNLANAFENHFLSKLGNLYYRLLSKL